MASRISCLLVVLSVVLLSHFGCISEAKLRGVATNAWSGGCADLEALDRVSWYWNYALTPTTSVVNCSLGHEVEFIPQIWGSAAAQRPNLASQIPQGTTHLFAFNEPNFSSQSNLTPAQAAALWKQVMAQLNAAGLSSSIKFGTPSASPGGDNLGCTEWLSQFLANCTGCRFDFITFHNYDCNQYYYNGASTMYWVKLFHNTFPDLPIWLTEFSCTNANVTVDQELKYMTSLLEDLDNATYVERYSWFTARPTNLGTTVPALLNAAPGSITRVGTYYNAGATAPPSTTGGGDGGDGGGSGGVSGSGNTASSSWGSALLGSIYRAAS